MTLSNGNRQAEIARRESRWQKKRSADPIPRDAWYTIWYTHTVPMENNH